MRWSMLARAAVLVAPSSSFAQTIRWPAVSEELWTTFGEYQDYSGYCSGPYLHPGLDIAPQPYSRVFSIAKGRVTGMRWDDKIITRPDGIDTSVEVKEPGEASVIVQDLGAANEPLDEGWLYGHIDDERVKELSEGESPYGWTRDPGDVLTIIHPEADHLHLDRIRMGDNGRTEWSPVIEDPLRVFKGAGVVVTADPVAPFFGPEYEYVTFDFDESSPCYPNQVLPDFVCPYDVPNWPSRRIKIVFGKVDIVARVDDWFGQPGQPGDDRSLGVAAIGYEIRVPWLGSLTVVGPYTREFRGEIQNAQGENISKLPAGMAKAVYRQTAHFPSTNENAFYSVTNYHDQMPDNWSVEARAACWNTRMVRNGGLPWEAQDATQDADPNKPGYPEFKDGSYFVRVTVNDGFFPDVQAQRLVVVDNFAPFLKGTKVYRQCIGPGRGRADIAEESRSKGTGGGGSPEERDWNALYQAEWELTQGTELALRIHHREPAAVDEELLVRLEFSECMAEALVMGSWDVEAGEVVPGDWVDEDHTIWEGLIPVAGALGRRRLLVRGTDMAGNHLDPTPDHVISREEDGSWDDPGYNPDADMADLNHWWPVSPDLWVLERTSDGSRRLGGYDKYGEVLVSVSLGAGSGTDRLVCAGDPVQGGCWVFGRDLGIRYYDLDGVGHMFFESEADSPQAEWIGADHQQFGCWRVESSGAAVRIQRRCVLSRARASA